VIIAAVGLVTSLAAAPAGTVSQAAALAAHASELVARDPEAAWQEAERALGLTERFDPTDFAAAGRRGEMADDTYREARAAYRRHRAGLFLAAGRVQMGRGRFVAAERYLRRALELDPGLDRVPLAGCLLALGRGWDALDIVIDGIASGAASPGASAEAARAADLLGLPSIQAEIDRRRVLGAREAGLKWIGGPLALPERARLSTGARFSFSDDDQLRVVYVAQGGCATCSADLESLGRLVPDQVQILVVAQGDDDVLRRVLALYQRTWPLLRGEGVGRALPVEAPAVLFVARSGWSVATAAPPLERSVPALMGILRRTDIVERVPRSSWNGSAPRRPAAERPSRQGLAAGSLAPGEDEPWPEEFTRAQQSYRDGRYADALALIERLAQRDDGWLLSPEARLDEALCLAGQGRRSEARRRLLRIGDSRYQEDVDRLIETLGTPADSRAGVGGE
jgi:tetratricopeptide (TPR) repeat protein